MHTLPLFILRYLTSSFAAHEIYGGHLFCMQASICMHRFLVNFIWVGMEIWRERRTQPITMISTVQKGFYGMQIHWKDCCWQKMLDTPQKLGFIFLCPSGKMPSSHAIKMTHKGHDEMRSALMPWWIDALCFSQCAVAPEPQKSFSLLSNWGEGYTLKEESKTKWRD